MHTICIDFGTSSIRAALRKNRAVHPLKIAPRSQIDNASIPSAIFIPKAGDEVLFGVKALERGLAGEPSLLFETSPKAWLSPTNTDALCTAATPHLPFSRWLLLAGLLSLAVRDARRAAQRGYELDADSLAYRISHPVWESAERSKMNVAYDDLRRVACAEIGGQMRYQMTAEEFRRWCISVDPVQGMRRTDVEVEEPVAASLELFPDPPINRRSAALVVDVGAGTIDLGLFASVVPDKGSKAKRKLIPMAAPRSLFGAGDEIDKALINLVEVKFGSTGGALLAEFRNGIRRSKEQLFESGSIVFRNIEVSRQELVKTAALRGMAGGLKQAIEEMFAEAGEHFKVQLNAPVHGIGHLDVVFAGGGAKLEFLRALVGSVVSMGTAKLSVRHVEVNTPDDFEVEASRTRMAVALGGTTNEKDWPKTEMQEAIVRTLSVPLK